MNAKCSFLMFGQVMPGRINLFAINPIRVFIFLLFLFSGLSLQAQKTDYEDREAFRQIYENQTLADYNNLSFPRIPWLTLFNDAQLDPIKVIELYKLKSVGIDLLAEFKGLNKRFHFYEEMSHQNRRRDGKFNYADLAQEELDNFKNKRGAKSSATANFQFIGQTVSPLTTNNGRIERINFHPTDPSIIWASAPEGGLWRSNDTGANWTLMSDFWDHLSVGDLIYNTHDNDTLYCATGDHDSWFNLNRGILRSDDGGTTWNIVGLPFSQAEDVHKLMMHPDGRTPFVCTSQGVFYSSDQGVTWIKLTALSGDINDLEFQPGNANIMYATERGGGSPYFGYFHVSTDGGMTWTQQTATFDSEGRTTQVCVSPNDPDVAYLGTYPKTTGGFGMAVMKYVHSTGAITSISDPNATLSAALRGAWDFRIEVDPADSDHVIYGCVFNFETFDGGVTWTHLPNLHADVHDIKWQSTSNKLWIADDGGLGWTTDGGANWTSFPNLPVMQWAALASSADGDVLYLGAQDAGCQVDYDGFYSQPRGGGDGLLGAVDPVDPTAIYTTVQQGLELNRLDYYPTNQTYQVNYIMNQGIGGSVAPWGQNIIIDREDHNTIYTNYADIWKSTDQGANWTNMTNGSFGNGSNDITYFYQSQSHPDIMYGGLNGFGDLKKSTDRGLTWTTITHPSVYLGWTRSFVIHPQNPDILWVCGSSSVLKSIDGGMTWSNISGSLPAGSGVFNLAYHENGNDGIYVAGNLGNLFYLDNSLTDWIVHDQLLPNVRIYQLEVLPEINKIRVATWGRGVWEGDTYAASSGNCVEPAPPTITATLCATNIMISIAAPPAGYAIEWYRDGTIVAGETSATLNSIIAGTYEARYADQSGTCHSYLSEEASAVFNTPVVLNTGEGMHFDGTDDNITLPNGSLDLVGKSFSVEFWVKRDALNSADFVMNQGGSNTTNNKMVIGFEANNEFKFGFFGNDLVADASYADLEWHHWACVYDTSIVSPDHNRFIYRDGILVGSDRSSSPINQNGELKIGHLFGTYYFEGILDEIKIWDKARTQTEIANSFYCPLTCFDADLLLYIPFNEGTANGDNTALTSIIDYSIYAHSCPLSGFTLDGTTSNLVTGLNLTRYSDSDTDGFGLLSGATTDLCSAGDFSFIAGDCNDTNNAVHPNSFEICENSLDDNCDGATDIEINRALDFNGTNNLVNIPAVAHSSAFSFEAWIKINSGSTGDQIISEWYGTNRADLRISSSGILNYFENGGGFGIGGQDLRDDAWHHIALTHDGYSGANIRLYVDGIQSTNLPFTTVVTSTTNTLGADRTGALKCQGAIDDVRFWDVVLTPTQILDRMAIRLDGTETNLVRYYPLDQGIAAGANSPFVKALDKTSSAQHGDLINFSLSGTSSNWINSRSYPALYVDGDMDGFGGNTSWTCGSMTALVSTNTDCNDALNTLNPGTPEICGNGIDDNCNGVIDENTMALNFDGTNDFVDLGTTLGNFGTSDFTLEAKFKNTGVRNAILSKRPTCGCDNFWNILVNDTGEVSFEIYENASCGNGAAIASTTNVDDNAWHHVAITRSGTVITMYIDGVVEGTSTSAANINNAANFDIGKSPCDFDNFYFNGSMDEIRIWNIARSANEINIYKNGSLVGNEAGLEAYYNFNNENVAAGTDNSTQATLEDLANSFDGTLTDFTLTAATSNWIENPAITQTWYADTDNDNYGDPAVTTIACAQPTGYVADNTDCDDTMMSVNPGATEVAGNGIDDDCDNAIDEISEFKWVLLDNGEMEGSCSSSTDCCTNTFCFGLEYTPGTTGTLAAYTTGFLVDCVSGGSPVISNSSCVMTDNSGEIDGCAMQSQTLINSSGNTGTTEVTSGTAIIIHQICITIPPNTSLNLSEDLPTDLSTSIDLIGGGVVSEYPVFTPISASGNVPPVVTAGSIAACYDAIATAEAAAIAATSATDDCPGTITYSASTSGTCTATITVTASDACGLMASVDYNTSIHLTAPTEQGGPVTAASTVECLVAATAPTILPVVHDVCGTLITAPTPTITDSPDPVTCEGTRIYQYTYTDCAGLDFVWTYTYTIDHSTAPTEQGGPVATTATVECLASATAPTALPVVHDVCGAVIPAPTPTTTDSPDPVTCEGSRIYQYTYSDCGGLDFVWTFTYTIDHSTAPTEQGGPVATMATVECLSSATAPTTLPVVHDVCGTVITAPTPTITDSPDPVTCEGSRIYQYTYSDCAGLDFVWTYTYTIDHTSVPTEIGGPVATSATVECLSAATAPITLPVVHDVCGTVITAPTPTITDSPDPVTCEGSRIYQYTYSDCSGLDFVWTFTYTIDHTTAPTEIGGPVSTSNTVECLTAATEPMNLPIVQDVCGAVIPAPTPSFVDSPSTITCEGSRVYTYTYSDCSGLDFVWTYTYTIDHTSVPTEIGGPVATSATVECLSAATAPATLPVVQDVCGTVITAPTPTISDSPDPVTCEGSRIYQYTYSDCSGLDFVWTFTYTIDHTSQPTEIGGPVSVSSTIQNVLDTIAPTILPVVQDVCGDVLTPAAPVQGGTYVTGNCSGTVTYTFTYTDCSGLTFDWVYTYTIDCGVLNIFAFLEGSYDTDGDSMTHLLNDNHLLPGMDKSLSPSLAVQISAPHTPFGQPYIELPWNYTGNLGMQYGDATAPGAPGNVEPYPTNVVDWILVSVRENGILHTDDVFECAGWLHRDGSISFPEDCTAGFTINTASDYYVVLQHRNHLAVMDTAMIMGGGSYLEIDFRNQNSYRPNIFRVGQKELEAGVWGMLNSNGEQVNSPFGINSVDRTIWKILQNNLGYYKSDHDLNVNSNSQDETLWKINQNKTTGVDLDE